LRADVVTIEPPEGDFARRIPFAVFRMANRNRRSMVVDLKHRETPRLVAALARRADAAVEGFRPGVAARPGIDHATLSRHNPRLAYCSLSGYGQTSPDHRIPGRNLDISRRPARSRWPGTGPNRSAPGCRLRTSPAGVTRRSPSWRRCTSGGTGRGAYLDLHDVPAQRRLTPAEAVRSPQSFAREKVLELNGERHIPFPVLVDGRRGGVLGNAAPAPGADAQSILGELGLTPAEIAALRRSGLIGNQAQDASI
jgi:crotonobetainyl-CoA:carnitine CoA-transferase CaiB-like acyl-CoA transferase